jgi:hypothetical protein
VDLDARATPRAVATKVRDFLDGYSAPILSKGYHLGGLSTELEVDTPYQLDLWVVGLLESPSPEVIDPRQEYFKRAVQDFFPADRTPRLGSVRIMPLGPGLVRIHTEADARLVPSFPEVVRLFADLDNALTVEYAPGTVRAISMTDGRGSRPPTTEFLSYSTIAAVENQVGAFLKAALNWRLPLQGFALTRPRWILTTASVASRAIEVYVTNEETAVLIGAIVAAIDPSDAPLTDVATAVRRQVGDDLLYVENGQLAGAVLGWLELTRLNPGERPERSWARMTPSGLDR